MTTNRKTASRPTSVRSDEALSFVVVETSEPNVFTFDLVKDGDDAESIYSTADVTPEQVLLDLLAVTPAAKLNPHMAWSTRADWYTKALNPKYIKGVRNGEPKFRHPFAVARLLEWLKEGNEFVFERYIGGKPQLKDPKAKVSKTTARRLIRRG